jgi:hypothetical protein
LACERQRLELRGGPVAAKLGPLAALLLLLVQPGCAADTSSPDASVADCGPNLKPYRTACLPLLKLCSGDQVSQPGGGCKQVGVEECQGGIRTTPGGACERVGPPLSCPHGWVATKDGWCEPTLPTTACPDRKMEVLGQFACQEISACGAPPWGSISVDSKTVFVDASYQGSDADGTKTRPFAVISAALKAAPSGGAIAMAAGSYAEDLALTKPVTLEGRCAKLVTIKGQATSTLDDAAVTVSASGVTVRGVTVTGPVLGVLVKSAKVTLEQIVVEACGLQGIRADAGAVFTVKDALVAKNAAVGIGIVGAEGTLERVVVRETKPTAKAGLEHGHGVEVTCTSQKGASLVMRDCLVDSNHATGVALWGATGTLERTVVRRTQPRLKDNEQGFGVQVRRHLKTAGTLVMKGSVVAENHHRGLEVLGAKATLERTVIRDTKAVTDAKAGGVYASPLEISSTLVLRQCAVVRNRTVGLYLRGATAELDRTIVRDTQPHKSDKAAGFGIYAGHVNGPTQLTIKRSILSDNRTLGLALFSSTAKLEQSVIRSTQPRAKDSLFGSGVQALSGTALASLVVNDCLVKGNIGAGIALHGAKSSISDTIVRDTLPQQPDRQYGLGIQAQWWKGRPSEATISDTVVSHNHRNGIRVLGANVVIERSTIRNTSAQPADKASGIGIYVGPGEGSSKLTLLDSLIASNKSNGVSVWSTKAIIKRVVVQDSKLEASSGGYGDGIEIGRLDGGAPGKITLTDSLVERSHRAGLMLVGVGGEVRRSTFRGGLFPIALTKGADADIADNVYEQNADNRISLEQLPSAQPNTITLPPAPAF